SCMLRSSTTTGASGGGAGLASVAGGPACVSPHAASVASQTRATELRMVRAKRSRPCYTCRRAVSRGGDPMHTNRLEWAVCGLVLLGLSATASGQSSSTHDPTWWDKFQLMSTDGPDLSAGATSSAAVGKNVDVSNECGPQSETFITLDPNRPNVLAAGSNEIFRLPMRGYFSTDGGATWGGVDLPLPPPRGASGSVCASDPTVAFDTLGNVFYGYIVVHFSPNRGLGLGFKGTGVAVARSSDGGRTYPFANFFSFEGGENHFNDKPMITADTSPSSPFRDNVYIAWDAPSGAPPGGGSRAAVSPATGAPFTITRADNPFGPGRSIGTPPFVGPNRD